MIDAASGGALVDKTPEATRNLIANMVANSQQFGTRLDFPSKNVNEVNISSLEQQIASLTSLVRQMAVGNMQTVKACGICSVVGHSTDMCPTLQEEPTEQMNVASDFPRKTQRKYDPYSNTYNMGWRDHPNLSYGSSQVNQPTTQNHPSYQQYRQPYPPRQQSGQTSNSGERASIQSLDNQMGQMATTISRLVAQNSGKLPSQTVVNPREIACAIILRSGKEVEIPVKAALASLEQEKEKEVVADRNVPDDDDVPKCKFPPLSDYKPVPPFPQALAYSRKDEQNKDLYETFRRCEVNIPLLDAIKQVLRYAKFLKELCTIKRKYKLKGCEKVIIKENVSAIIQRKFPAKCKDPGRPFLKTSKTKIDVHSDTLTMEFDGEIVKFNIYEAMKYPGDDNPIYFIDVIDSFTQEVFELDEKDELLQHSSNVLYIELPVSNERPLPSILQAPTRDLKPLPSHLKYMLLGNGGMLPVIIFNKLSAPKEEEHVQDELHLQETFPDEQLLAASVTLPWYANIVNYLVINMLPPGLSRAQRDKVKSDTKYYVWDDP
ncbi:uncharacterized protein [Aristolochia californica]|uniref:uncharacterized protein n=1 Tax=Aristolochia californica TaxID=171875 RepID=UPI0035DDF9ED